MKLRRLLLTAGPTMTALPQLGEVLRTPDQRFARLPDFPWSPRYTDLGGLRVAHLDEGPQDAPTVLLMHREPTWSFLYRKMIPVLLSAGLRVVAPDLVGFGRSDKPARAADHSYLNHVQWMTAWLLANDLRGLTLFGQDWGSLIGLRLAAEQPDRFERIVLANGGLPTGTTPVPRAFQVWRAFARYSPWFPIGRIVKAGRPLVVANTRHSPGYVCALRLDRTPLGALLGHARKTLSL